MTKKKEEDNGDEREGLCLFSRRFLPFEILSPRILFPSPTLCKILKERENAFF